ncbi:hypothetical protein [Stieleria mannarensis]|uniref:hypothetical protein n=1 Tax=Stieleria mannarensis TaxID=2755585 RepID=UPI001603D09A|nr:hypothetical protein [Rhodopirellula sp. JC639]
MDDNVRDIGGHYLELASLLADGAYRLGYLPQLVAHQTLPKLNPDLSRDSRLDHLCIDARFAVRRMENWSLGVDGSSHVGRDIQGTPNDGALPERLWQTVCDGASRPARRPKAMLQSWASVFAESVLQFSPRPLDKIVVNTGGDFQLLALAHAVGELDRRGETGPMTIHVVFHFAVYETVVTARARAFGRQVNAAMAAMQGHRVHLHATTESLQQQLAAVGVDATAIPYPTRYRSGRQRESSSSNATKILLAGMPRAEKGRGQIYGLLESIERPLLRSGRFVWSMQLPPKRWQRMIPPSMQSGCDAKSPDQTERLADAGLEVLRGNLTSQAYHDWLDTAGIGLFLYDPGRYVARCSGVLLEMMIRGVPVIVPDGCWLADQVRQAEHNGPIGWIYRSVDQIPEILNTAEATLAEINANCRRHAAHIAAYHSGKNSLLKMGIDDHAAASVRQAS